MEYENKNNVASVIAVNRHGKFDGHNWLVV